MPQSRSATPDQTRQQDARGGDLSRRTGQPGMQRYSTDPFSNQLDSFRRLSDDMDRLFGRLFGSWAMGRPRQASGMENAFWTPRIEAFQKDDQFIVRAELPGLNKDDVRVNVTDNSITIEGERKHELEEDRGGMFHSERSYGSFYREIPLPEGAIGDKAEATFKDGVLEVRLDAPPHEVTRGRSIEIK